MVKLPILFNGDYSKVVGSIELSADLEKLYQTDTHLVINPTLRKEPGKDPEVIAFCIYPAPAEPAQPKKRARKQNTV